MLIKTLTLSFPDIFQSQVVSDPLRLNGALDGLVLGGLPVFGVASPPLYVLANGDKVRDFTYRSDTKVNSVCPFLFAHRVHFVPQNLTMKNSSHRF